MVAKPWIETPVDFDKIKSVLPKSTLIISDNDPFNCLDENKTKFSRLGSSIITIPGGGHFTGKDGYSELHQILTALNGMKKTPLENI